MSRLRQLVLLLNERCNLRCGYCHFRSPDEHGRELEPELVARAVSLFFEAARDADGEPCVLSFDADGDAVMTRALLVHGLRQAARLRAEGGLDNVTIVLNTNGTLVDGRFAKLLARLDVAVTISLDGPAGCHDFYRIYSAGHGSYDQVRQGLGELHRHGVSASLRAVHGPATLPWLRHSWSELRGHAPPRPIKLRPVRLPGPPWIEPAWAAAYARAYRRAVRAEIRGGAHWMTLPDHARHFATWMKERKVRDRVCEAGHSMLWLSAGGDLLPCGLLSRGSRSMGKLSDIHDLEALEALLDHPLSAAMRDNAPGKRDPCRSCRWLPACAGGCPMEAMDADLQPVEPPLCVLYRSLGDTLEEEL